MMKLIGGLLMVSFLSMPSTLKVDYIAYEVYKASDQIIRGICVVPVQEDETAEEDISQMDIEAAFEGIDRNAKGISRLLKDLNSEMGKMSAVMQLKSITKESMSEEQIQVFSDFSAFYSDGTENLNETLSHISGDINDHALRSEIMADDTDFNAIYGQLMNITDNQSAAITNISCMIKAAKDTLELIA